MEALRHDPFSKRLQEQTEALRRDCFSLEATKRKVREMVRSWRADPYWVLLAPFSTLKQRRAAARRIAAAQPPMRFNNPPVRTALRRRRRKPRPGNTG